MTKEKKTTTKHQATQFITVILVLALGFVLGQVSPRLIGSGESGPAPQQQVQQQNQQQTQQSVQRSTPIAPPAQQGPAWVVRCGDRVEGQPRRPCEMVQSISMRETGQRVAEMALTAGYTMTDEGEVMDMIGGLALVPLGIATEEGLIIRIDDAPQARQYPIQGCAAQGCQARIAFTREEARRMAHSETLSLITRNTQGQSVVIPMSLEGFGDAMAEMQEKSFAP